MKLATRIVPAVICGLAMFAGCSGGSSNNADNTQPTGLLSLAITDGPWHDAGAMNLHVTGVRLGHAEGHVTHIDLPGGPLNLDMMQLQNGVSYQLMTRMRVPAGEYTWMRLMIDTGQSYFDDASTGGRHELHMGSGAGNWLEAQGPFYIGQGALHEFMLDYDIRMGLHQLHMGMMGDRFELRSAMRCVDLSDAGGLNGTIDASLIDVNNASCDAAPGGNWVYLFPGDATAPDDIASVDSDGVPGPIATDRVEMHNATGDYWYHFGHVESGSYRVAFTCSGEWDEDGDDDYPDDPDNAFDFHAFTDPVDVVAGEMTRLDIVP